MKPALTLAAFLLAALACSAPQPTGRAQKSPEPAVPTVEQIIGKYVQAIGGEPAHRKLTSRVAKGTFVLTLEGESVTGTFESYEKAPNKSLVVFELPGIGSSSEGFDGTGGWTVDPGEEPRPLTPAELASAKVDADFYKEIRLRELFPRLTLKGAQRLGGRTVYRLEGVSAEGYTENMDFDAESGLIVRSDAVVEDPEGKTTLEIHHEDYREIDGIRMPFAARHKSPGVTIELKIVEVRHNVPVADSVFQKPPAGRPSNSRR